MTIKHANGSSVDSYQSAKAREFQFGFICIHLDNGGGTNRSFLFPSAFCSRIWPGGAL